MVTRNRGALCQRSWVMLRPGLSIPHRNGDYFDLLWAKGIPDTRLDELCFCVAVPSCSLPFLTLLIILSNRCERMGECYAYNLESEKSRMVRDMRRPYGLCICDVCERAISDSSILTSPNHARVAIARHSRVQAQAQIEHGTGDKIGSLVLANRLKQVIVTYPKAQHQQRVSDLLDKVDEVVADTEHERADFILDEVCS